MWHRARMFAIVGVGLLATSCLLGNPSASQPTASVPPTPSSAAASVEPSAAPTPATTAQPTATPNLADVPLYPAGSLIETDIGGLRVRARPGLDERVVTGLLPDGADLLVALGPVVVDGYGWYQVRDADEADPEFETGWVAAGFDPEPFLVPALFDVAFNPYVAGFAGDADGDYGPVRVTDANYSILWVISPPTLDGCSFAVDLRRGNEAPVPAIRSTVGAVVAPGVLHAEFFADHPELVGDLFVSVVSNCSWALTFEKFPG